MNLFKRLLLALFLCGALVFIAHPAVAVTARFGESTSLLPNGAILIAGGQTTPAPSSALSEAELIMPDGTVATVGNMSVSRSSHTATVLPNGLVLVAGGINSAGTVNQTADIYNPATNSWATGALPKMSFPRFGHTATLLPNGNVLICGGYSDTAGTAQSSCDLYIPDMSGGNGNFAASGLPVMNTARAFHSASLLSSGDVFIAGGITGAGAYTPTTEIYSPQSNAFSAARPLIEERAFHTATALGNGQILIAGGANSVYLSMTEAEIYDPNANTMSPAAPMNEGRMEHAAILEVDGSVRVSGGLGPLPTAQDSDPTLSVVGNINYIGTSFTAQSLNIINTPPIQLALSVDAAGVIIGSSVSFPTSILTFSSGTITVDTFTVAIPGGTGSCIYNSGAVPPQWQCGIINLPTTITLSGTITCTTPPCQSPITFTTLTPGSLAPATPNTPVEVAVSSMIFADEELYAPSTNQWTLLTGGLAGPGALTLLPSNEPPYDWARFAHTSLLTPEDNVEVFGGATYNGSAYLAISNANADVPFTAPPQLTLTEIPVSLPTPQPGLNLPSPVAYNTSTLLPNGKILIAGGKNSTGALSSGFLFDPTVFSFTPTAPLHDARDRHTATLLPNGNILAAGGFNESTGTLSSAEIYSSIGNAWMLTGSMNFARNHHTATILPSGNVLVLGGEDTGGGATTYLNSAEIYYSTSGVWAPAASIPLAYTNNSSGVALHTATLLKDGTILVAGGINANGPLKTAEIYNPSANSWSSVGALPNPLYSHTATLLSNGSVLVAGGDGGVGETTTSILYNPTSQTWSATSGTLNTARLDHNALLLPSGGVLVSGGFSAAGGAVGSIEIYDSYSQSWHAEGMLSPARGGHTTIMSPSGTIYDFGGLSSISGGNYLSNTDSFYFSAVPDQYTLGAPPSLRQPTLNAVNIPILLPGASVTVTGSHFHGVTEASGGGASSANSDQDKPRLYLQATDNANANLIDLSTQIYSGSNNPSWSLTDSSITVQLPPTINALPYGWYYLREAVNAQFSPSLLVHAGPPLPTAPVSGITSNVISSATVSWTWNAAGGTFDGYDVYSATDGVFLSTDAQVSFLETGLAPNTTVQLLVAPYTLSGDGPGTTSGITYTLAATPQSLLISSDTGSNLILGWNQNNNSQGTVYEISESTDGFVNSFSTPIPTSLAYTSTQATISNLQMDTTYYFRVRAFNSNGIPSAFNTTPPTPYVSTTTVNQVFNLTGNPTGTTAISWSWTSLALPAGGYFAIYNATSASNIPFATTMNTSFSDIGLSTNSPRSIQVAAVTPSGQGPPTSPITVYTSAAIPALIGPIVNIATSGFTAQWAPNGNPANTNYQCTVTGVNLSTNVFSTLTTNSGTALFCNVSGLPLPGSFYQTQVVAINGDGLNTNPLNLGTTETYAAAPSGLTVLGSAAGSISISWSTTTNSSLDSYQVTYSTDDFVSNISTALSFSSKSNQSEMTIPGLIGGYTYWTRVQADNQNGALSAFSTVISTLTFNNGAPPGTLGAYVIASSQTLISGMLENGQVVSLQVPANSFSGDTFIIISTISMSPSPCPNGSGIGLSITASPPLEPVTPLTLTLSYFSSQIPSTPPNFLAEASLMRVTGTNSCVPVETKINATANQLTATLNHISQFELAQVTPGTGVNSVLIFPNPFYPSRGNGYVTFKNLPAGARVRLYTIRGEMVFEGTANASGLFDWPGTNRGGRLVASGVYLVEVNANGSSDMYKVAVER